MRGMKRKISQILLLLMFVFVMLTVSIAELRFYPMTYGAVDENGVFHIRSLQDLRWFLHLADEGHEDLNAVLEADIDTGGAVIYAESYAGHFDGQGHTLSNQRHPIWVLLEKRALVENLNIKDMDMKYEEVSTGGIVRRNYGEIRNCRVSGRIESPKYAGGIAAGNFGVISNCINYADIISNGTEENFEKKYDSDGFGAGGIAGRSGTGASKRWAFIPETNAIIGCENYGSVTAQTLAGGICAYMEDRTNGGASNLSVQELVETTDFGVYKPNDYSSSPEAYTREDGKEAVEIEGDLINGKHYSMIDCKNYGTVTVNQVVDINNYNTAAAGICGELNYGDLYHCANLGRVMISDKAPKESDTGWIYANKPYAVTEAMGLSPSMHHIVDCVNLKGTMPGSMWRESVMEVTEEELTLWEKGELPYVSNNWRFQLDEAVRVCSLEPLEIEENDLTKKRENFYQCEEFVLALPKGFSIEEEYVGDICYALHITVNREDLEMLPKELQGEENTDFEVWLLRKEADTANAFKEAAEVKNPMAGMEHKYFMEEIYDTIPNYWFLNIDSINPPFHVNSNQINYSGKRIFMEKGLPSYQLDEYQQEGGHVLGNLLSMPLEGNLEEGFLARWLFVFTNRETNIHPDRDYVDMVEQSFYTLDGGEIRTEIREGDTLIDLAHQYTGDSRNWKLLADMNGIESPDEISYGDFILIPDREAYEKKPWQIENWWFPGEKEED